jgi:glycosyltransferase involved in cell wall biosynthesis
MTVVVNGRFLRAQPVGLHRVARKMLDAAIDAGLALRVFAPPGVDDARVDRRPWAPPGRYGDHVWEQVSLPIAARGRLVLSLANTAPLSTWRSAVLVHDLAPLVGPQWFTRSTVAYARLVVAAARRARVVLTVSHCVRDELVAAGIDAAKLAVIRPAVDPGFRPSTPADIESVRHRYGLRRPFALVVGWCDPRKDALTAVHAHLAALRVIPHDLVLVGRPHPTFAPVALPQAPSVRRLGYVPDDDLRSLLTAAVALVYPSRYEGFGLPPLEAWACGTPALVSDIPVLRETTEGRGDFVPSGDPAAWADALLAALRGELNVHLVPSRTWTEVGRDLRKALAER